MLLCSITYIMMLRSTYYTVLYSHLTRLRYTEYVCLRFHRLSIVVREGATEHGVRSTYYVVLECGRTIYTARYMVEIHTKSYSAKVHIYILYIP